MGFLQSVIETLVDWVLTVWPGVLLAMIGAYLGHSMLGFPGFLVGAAAGAFAGAWIGHRLGIVPVRRMTNSRRNDHLVYAGSAFVLVVAGYLLLNVLIIIAAIAAVAVLVLFWLSN